MRRIFVALCALSTVVVHGYQYSQVLTPGYTLEWNNNGGGSSYDFRATWAGSNPAWIGLGISENGYMIDTPLTNAIICPCESSAFGGAQGSAQAVTLNARRATGLWADPSTGIYNLACSQSGSTTVMTWTRVRDNGNSTVAQIKDSGITHIAFAVGRQPMFNTTARQPSPMNSVEVDLTVDSAPVSPSPQPSPSSVASQSPTRTPTPSSQPASVSPTSAASQTRTATPTPQPSQSSQPSTSSVASQSRTATASSQPSASSSSVASQSRTATASTQPSVSSSSAASQTRTATPTPQPSTSPSSGASLSRTATASSQPSHSAQPSPSASSAVSASGTATASAQPSVSASSGASQSPTATATAQPSASASTGASSSQSASATAQPSASPSAGASSSPSPTDTCHLTPSTLSASSTQSASASATCLPSVDAGSRSHTPTPSSSGSCSSSATPSASATTSTTALPSYYPGVSASTTPSTLPSASRSVAVSASTASSPSRTRTRTVSVSKAPSSSPSAAPTASPQPAKRNMTMLCDDLLIEWTVAPDGVSASFTATLFKLCWFGISLSGDNNAVVCSPAEGNVTACYVTPTGIQPSNAVVLYDGSVSQTCGQTIMHWSQQLNENESDFAETGRAIVTYFVGVSNTLPMSSTQVTEFASNLVSMSPADANTVCNSVKLASGLQASWAVLDGNMISAEIVLKGRQSWVAFGWNTAGSMLGADVVIGRWDLGAPSVAEYKITDRSSSGVTQYENQSLSGTSLTFENGNTVMKFVRPFRPPNDEQFVIPNLAELVTVVSAHGSGTGFSKHSADGIDAIDFMTCDIEGHDAYVGPYQIAHAVCMGVGAGILLPLGALTAVFGRGMQPMNGPGAWWFIRHRAIQWAGALCVLAGFGIAVYMVNTDGDHFDCLHAKLGLALVAAIVLQIFVALIRPHPVPVTVARRVWAAVHRVLGFGILILSGVTIYYGLKELGVHAADTVAFVYIIVFSVSCGLVASFVLWRAWMNRNAPDATDAPKPSENAV